MRISIAITVALYLAIACASASGDQGIRGRTSREGVLVEDVAVTAYSYRPGGFGPLTGEVPAGTAKTGTDGSYALALPPGRYVVEALKKNRPGGTERPETDDYYCLYAGSPVTVTTSAWTAVGLNLVTVPEESRVATEQSRLTGRITMQGDPAERVYLYIYSDASTSFRGPARLLHPVAKGTFRLRVPPGTYYLVARKRVRGGPYGPVEIGDWFNFYSRNPVVVGTGEQVSLEIPLVERLSLLEEDPGAYSGVPVRVVSVDGHPLKGFYVLAYTDPGRSGPPLATSSATGPDGRVKLPLPLGQRAYIRARRTLGGPLAQGEKFADGETKGGDVDELVLKAGAAR